MALIREEYQLRIFDVQAQVTDSGEYVLGAEQTGSHGCYLIYGRMGPHEKGRKLKAGTGHEEIFLAIKGQFVVTWTATGETEKAPCRLNEGQAFHLIGEKSYRLENTTASEAVYVLAGGHSSGGHH
jgi:hypothetical protein